MNAVVGWVAAVGLAIVLAIVAYRVVRSWLRAGRDL
jgi:hypothetical protein